MRFSKSIMLLAAIAASGLGSLASAHHSFSAEFDSAKPITLEGVITKVRLVNPHSWLYVDVKDKNGAITNWGFEFGTPSTLRERGLSKDDVRPGLKIRIDGYRAKNGGAFGYSRLATLADGRTVQTGGAVDAPAAKK